MTSFLRVIADRFFQTTMDTPEEDLAEDMQAMNGIQDLANSSPGPGPRTRRRRGPGNLWTLEARMDMFRRRDAGEGWETIILVGGLGIFPCMAMLPSCLLENTHEVSDLSY